MLTAFLKICQPPARVSEVELCVRRQPQRRYTCTAYVLCARMLTNALTITSSALSAQNCMRSSDTFGQHSSPHPLSDYQQSRRGLFLRYSKRLSALVKHTSTTGGCAVGATPITLILDAVQPVV